MSSRPDFQVIDSEPAEKPQGPPVPARIAAVVFTLLSRIDRVDVCVLAGLYFVHAGVSLWSQPSALLAVGSVLLVFALMGARR